MRALIFQVDAFTSRRFSGNPAAVMPLERFPDAQTMQTIAGENNLAETAFIVPEGSDYRIRWFTPTTEVPLRGHATFASAAVVMERLDRGRERVVFHSASGPLVVNKISPGYVMDFPARQAKPVPMPATMPKALGVDPVEVLADAINYLARLDSASTVRDISPDFPVIAALDRKGLIVTAQGDGNFDFVSRYFAPAKGVPEYPVTGSAHCTLVPYWAGKLQKTEFRAFQASRRGGEIGCRYRGDRVELSGCCAFYMAGETEF